REAVEAFATLAAIDTSLVPLSRDLATLPAVARTFEAARRVDELVTSGATRTKLLAAARETNEAASDARAALIRSRRPELERAWSAVAGVEARAERAWREAERIAQHGRSPVLARAGDVERLALPGDPRLWMENGTDPARAVELRESFRERMGYTSPPEDLASEPAIVVRVVAEGAPRSGALVDPRDGFTVSLESTRRGWAARWPFSHWPGPDDPAPVLTFDPIARVEAVYFDRENGHPIFPWPHIRATRLSREGIAAKLAVTVEGDSVVAELVAEPVAGPTRTLWCGRLPEGPHERAFVLPSPDVGSLVLRWGRAGWRRVASVEIPGHDAARPVGFGALADGRALVAIGEKLSIVDPASGDVREIPWPAGRGHEAGREFCVACLADGRVLVRGADAGGGWAYFLDPEAGTWTPVPPGPESGTVAAHPDGGYGWLTGREIRRRDASGRGLPPLTVDRSGRLLGFDPSGHPVVRLESGDAVRLNPANGGVVNGVPGPALAMESSGAVVRLASLDARHREVALAVDLELGLTDGSTAGPFRLPFRPFPAEGQPAVRAAIAPDGSLFLLGGTTWWRHAPENDWWGATLERWEPLWTGESADPRGGQ
ncbi:MAG: hypothetical protein KC591_15155, partial [Gemmatimonadetes bacterium]|nr:hypothetical protein [Gemmatimonadota bacterium]